MQDMRAEDGRRYAVLGAKHETQGIIDLLLALGLSIDACHEVAFTEESPPRRGAFGSFANALAGMRASACTALVKAIPRVGKDEFARLINDEGAGLIVAPYHVANGTDPFLNACTYAAETLGFKGRPLHLAALCDLFQFPGTRHLLTGLASSGNMVFQRVLEGLLQQQTTAPVLERDPKNHLLASFALNHLESIRTVFCEFISDVSVNEVLASGTHLNFGQCLVQKDDQYCAISGLPLRSYAWGGRWTSSHEPIKAQTADFYRKQGYEVVYILRHPLDVIVSNAAKLSTVVPGKRRPELALGNLQWFSDIVRTVGKHYEHLGEHGADLKCVRYEALIADPDKEISRLAAFLDVETSASLRESIWKSVDGVPIAGRQHFWDPRAGKWKEFLGPQHREIVFASSLPELARRFGYAMEPADFGGSLVREDSLGSVEPEALDRLAWIDAILEIPIGKPTTFAGDLVRVENHELGLVGFFDNEHADAGQSLLSSPKLERLVRSAFWHEHKPVPSTVRAYLGL
jgi:hypothetical protein